MTYRKKYMTSVDPDLPVADPTNYGESAGRTQNRTPYSTCYGNLTADSPRDLPTASLTSLRQEILYTNSHWSMKGALRGTRYDLGHTLVL